MGRTKTGIGFRLNHLENTLAVMFFKMLDLLMLYCFQAFPREGLTSVANEFALEMDFPPTAGKSISPEEKHRQKGKNRNEKEPSR